MKMSVDQTRHDQMAGAVDFAYPGGVRAALVGVRIDLDDQAAVDRDGGPCVLAAGLIHRQDAGVADDGLQRVLFPSASAAAEPVIALGGGKPQAPSLLVDSCSDSRGSTNLPDR